MDKRSWSRKIWDWWLGNLPPMKTEAEANEERAKKRARYEAYEKAQAEAAAVARARDWCSLADELHKGLYPERLWRMPWHASDLVAGWTLVLYILALITHQTSERDFFLVVVAGCVLGLLWGIFRTLRLILVFIVTWSGGREWRWRYIPPPAILTQLVEQNQMDD